MSRIPHSLVTRGFLGFGVVLTILLLSGALVSAQTGSAPEPLSAARVTATPAASQPPLPLPATTSSDVLPAYPGPSLSAPTPTPWLVPSIAPPVVSPTLSQSTTPTAVVPPATPTSASTEEATATPLPNPSPSDYYDSAYLARLPRVPRTYGQVDPIVGGHIDAGPLHLDFPSNAYHHPLTVDVQTETTYPRLKPYLTPRLFFTINLTDTVTHAPVHVLDRPTEMRIDLAAVPGSVVDGVNVALYYLDPTTLEWELVPSTLRGQVLVASVTQFSAYSLTTDFGKDWQPGAKTDTVNVDLITGSTTLAIPLDVPEGTAKMMPHLALSYSSVVPDQINDVLARQDALANESPSTQADWLGLGWSLDLGRITSVVTGIDQVTPVNGPAPNIPTYYLELNGTREKLICITPNCQNHKAKTDALEFKTERDSYLRIIRRYTPTLGKNDHGVWWEVWDRSGTYYRFGYSYNSEHLRGWAQYGGGEDNTWGGSPAWGYSLDRVVDTHGNRMEVDYFQDWYWPDGKVHSQDPYRKNKCEITWYDSHGDPRTRQDYHPYDRAAYPAVIRYTFSGTADGTSTFGQAYQREIRFNENLWRTPTNPQQPTHTWVTRDWRANEEGTTWGFSANRVQDQALSAGWDIDKSLNDYIMQGSGQCNYYYIQRYKLEEITSYIKTSPNAPELPFRKYAFTYDNATPIWDKYTQTKRPTIRLTAISEYAGANFATPLYASNVPSYKFSYDNFDGPGRSPLARHQLTRVETALGGLIDLTYQAYSPESRGQHHVPDISRNRVQLRKLNPMSGDPVMQYLYNYPSLGRYDTDNHRLIGFDWAQVTDAAGHAVQHFFFTNQPVTDNRGLAYSANDTKWLRGREYETDTVHAWTDGTGGGNGTKRRVLNQFRLPDRGAAGSVRAVELGKTWAFPDPANIVYPTGFADVQEYAYDDYGNVTDEWECEGLTNLSDPNPDRYNCAPSTTNPAGHYTRATKRWFEPRSTPDANAPGQYSYIVDKAVIEGVDGQYGVGPWWPKVTYYSYDGRSAIPWNGKDFVPGVAGPTTKGELTWMRRVDCWQCAPETTGDTHYDYDNYGNRTVEKTWPAFSVNGQTVGVPRPVTTTYESILHTFVEQITQPNNIVYEKAGWDDTAYRWQAPGWIEDANGGGSTVKYTYDDFGRRRNITRPGDTDPTEHYDYDYNAAETARLSVSAKKRLDANRVITSTVFYDGLGRPVLTKTEHPAAAGQAQAVATYYNNRGLKSADTEPYWPGTFNICGGNNTCFGGRPSLESPTLEYTTYQYDTFGALALTIRPDNTASVVTPIREQRKTYTADRTLLFDISGLNPSFETSGGGACAQGWTCGDGVAERVGTGVDGRFALRIGSPRSSGPVRAEASTTYSSVVLRQGSIFTLSWLARRAYGNGTVRAIVKVNGTEASGAADYPITAPDVQWQLFHRTFTAPVDGATLTVGFEIPAETQVEIDGLQMTWADVRERSEESDGLGRTTRVEERTDVAERLATTYAYDPLDRVISVTDPNGNVTTSSRLDPTNDRTRLDRLTVSDPDRGTWTYQYDPQGNVKLQTDGRGQQVSYSYDSLDRLTGKSYPNDPSTPSVTTTYDDGTLGAFRKGRRTQMSIGGDTVTYTYDGRGRVTQEARVIASWNYPTGYDYNSADKVIRQKYPDDEVVTTTYNSAGRISSVSGTSDYLASQTYNVAGQPTNATLGNAVHTAYDYDAASQRLTWLETVVKADGQDRDDPALQYFYDTFGNVTFIQNYWQPSENQSFSYDTLDRLTTADGPFAQTFAYDKLGNLTQRDGQTYRYEAGKPHAVSHLGTDAAARFGYDLAGAMTTRGSQSLGYDAEGRLTTVKWGATELETYRYDGDGALTRRTSTPLPAQALYSQDFASQAVGWTSASSDGGSVTWGVNPNDSTSHTTTLRLTGNATDWTVQAYRNGNVGDTQQARVAFKLSQTGSGAVVALESTDAANYVGVYEEQGALYLRTRVGASFTNQLTLMRGLDPTAWYVLEMAADEAAGFRVSVWQEGAEGTRFEARYEMPRGLSWRFHAWAHTGSLYLDGPIADGAYKEERPAGTTSDARVIGQYYEYDHALNRQTKRYYAEGKLLATRMTIFGCPPVGTCETLTYVQADHLGSTSTLTDASGKVVGRERYSAFGERRRGETPPTTDRLYTGQRLNVLSNLYHYSDGTSAGRFYAPVLARFIQPDSITPGKGSQALNRYAYANNSPLVLRDTTGHVPCNDTGPGCGTDMTDVPLSATPGPVSMMDPRLDSTILFYSSVYGIPPELLAGTLTAEAVDDQATLNILFRNLNVAFARMTTFDQRVAPWSALMGQTWITTIDSVERMPPWRHPGIGVENFHIDAARNVHNHFQTFYSGTSMANMVAPGDTVPNLLLTLASPEGNIRYNAAYLRELADLRTNRYDTHAADLTLNDMAIIYTAYRGSTSYPNETSSFSATQSPGVRYGPVFMHYVRGYIGYYR